MPTPSYFGKCSGVLYELRNGNVISKRRRGITAQEREEMGVEVEITSCLPYRELLQWPSSLKDRSIYPKPKWFCRSRLSLWSRVHDNKVHVGDPSC